MYSKALSYAVFSFRKKTCILRLIKTEKKSAYYKCFWNQFKTVQLQGPRTQVSHISRPCCVKLDQMYAYFSLAGLCFQHKDQEQSHTSLLILSYSKNMLIEILIIHALFIRILHQSQLQFIFLLKRAILVECYQIFYISASSGMYLLDGF